MQAHPEHHNVFSYYEVFDPSLKAEGSISTIRIVRRKVQPWTKIGKWISQILPAPTQQGSSSKDAQSSDNGEDLYALKTIQKEHVKNLHYLNEMRNEIRVLKHLDHKNIVRVYDSFENKNRIYLVMEYCRGGELYERSPYTEQDAAKIVRQILSAVRCMYILCLLSFMPRACFE